MINLIKKPSTYQKEKAIKNIKEYEIDENLLRIYFDGNIATAEILEDTDVYKIEYGIYKCSDCGAIVIDYLDYSGRYEETDRCHKCYSHYDYTEKESEIL